LPAGAVDAGENFVQAAHRETMEEAGIEINLLGILRVDYKVKED
jgi:phosphatase NudJ